MADTSILTGSAALVATGTAVLTKLAVLIPSGVVVIAPQAVAPYSSSPVIGVPVGAVVAGGTLLELLRMYRGYDESFGDDYIRTFILLPLPQLSKVVAGTVYDAAGSPAVRTVRAYRRSDGTLMGETTSSASGAYSIPCPDEEVYRVVLDDVAGALYNDLIDRVLPG